MNWFKKRKKQTPEIKPFPPIGALMVSKKVTEERLPVLFMYHEKPSRPEDSGWRLFSGFESDDFLANPANTGIYDPMTLIEMDQTIRQLLLREIGIVFERKNSKSDWYEVDDYPLDDDYIITVKLTEQWSFEINNLFQRITETNGDLLFTTGNKSVRIAVWNQGGQNAAAIYDEHLAIIESRDQTLAPTIHKYDRSTTHVKKTGYEIIESDESKSYHVIYAFNIIDEQLVQVALYFDQEKDREWALMTWDSFSSK